MVNGGTRHIEKGEFIATPPIRLRRFDRSELILNLTEQPTVMAALSNRSKGTAIR
jgi:hypothetical protein